MEVFFATTDTIIVSFFITGSIKTGIQIGSIEIISKMILYYVHERLWFKSKVANHKTRHLIKTFTWRFIGTFDTVIISFLIIGEITSGLKIGIIEVVTKMILYYIHEKLWYRLNFGLDKRKS